MGTYLWTVLQMLIEHSLIYVAIIQFFSAITCGGFPKINHHLRSYDSTVLMIQANREFDLV